MVVEILVVKVVSAATVETVAVATEVGAVNAVAVMAAVVNAVAVMAAVVDAKVCQVV